MPPDVKPFLSGNRQAMLTNLARSRDQATEQAVTALISSNVSNAQSPKVDGKNGSFDGGATVRLQPGEEVMGPLFPDKWNVPPPKHPEKGKDGKEAKDGKETKEGKEAKDGKESGKDSSDGTKVGGDEGMDFGQIFERGDPAVLANEAMTQVALTHSARVDALVQGKIV